MTIGKKEEETSSEIKDVRFVILFDDSEQDVESSTRAFPNNPVSREKETNTTEADLRLGIRGEENILLQQNFHASSEELEQGAVNGLAAH